MQLQTENLPGSQQDLKFQLDKDDVARAYAKVFSELADQGQIPGFRPGKAPAAVIRRRYKPEMLRDLFWMQAVELFVEPELKKDDLEIIGDPDFPDFSEIEVPEGEGVEFSIKITLRPEPVLPDYSDLKLYRADATVTDEDVAKVIEQMREAAAREVPVEDRDTVTEGDLVEAEVTVKTEDEEEEEPRTSSQTFEIGSGRYQPALDVEMIGHKVGDTVTVEYQYPEDHENPDLAGKKAVFSAEIEAINARILPELNDEFAQAQGEYENLEDLQAKLREKLEKDAAQQSLRNLETDALSTIIRGTELDLPQKLIDGVAERSYRSFLSDLQSDGLSLDMFKEIANIDESSLMANERMRAATSLTVELVLDALAKAEGVEVNDEALEEELQLFAAENNVDMELLRRSLDLQEDFREQMEARARRRLTLAAVLAKAEIEDVSKERYTEIKEERRAAEEEEARQKAEAAAAEAAAAEAAAAETAPEQEAAAEPAEAEETAADETGAAEAEAATETSEAATEAAADEQA